MAEDQSPPSGGEPRPPIDPQGVLTPPSQPPSQPYLPMGIGQGDQRGGGGMMSRITTGLVSALLVASLSINAYVYIVYSALISGPSEVTFLEGESKKRIVILPVAGLIDDSMAAHFRRVLLELRDDQPAAIVLRVDSPGGTVAASDRITEELRRFREDVDDQVPIVASFGSVAASGGYYVSADCDFIVAEPTAITGSIGVVAQAFTIEEMMKKLGVEPEVIVATGAPNKADLGLFESWTEEERAKLRKVLDAAHERFIQVVADGRSEVLKPEDAREAATGDIFTTGQAMELKLVDAEGYLYDAIDKARELAGMDPNIDPDVTIIYQQKGYGGLLLGKAHSMDRSMELDGQWLRSTLVELTTPKLEYRLRLLQP